MLKGLVGSSSILLALGLLGTVSYAVRELIAVLLLFSAGFVALFLIAIVSLLYFHATNGWAEWLRGQVPQWNRASRDWTVALFRSEQTPVLVTASVHLPQVKQLNRRAAFAESQE